MTKNGIELLLRHRLYGEHEHPYNWDKYVYDQEELHYGILSILLQASSRFSKAFLAVPKAPPIHAILPPSRRHGFDLEIQTGAGLFLVEIKTWAHLKPDQFARQLDCLRSERANGIYLLTPFQRSWTAERIHKSSSGRSRLLPFAQLADFVELSLGDLKAAERQLATAYVGAIRHLDERTREAA